MADSPPLPDLGEVLRRLSDGVVERDGAMRVALLGALAGENVLLLGPPGTAKSLVARRLAGVFADAHYFQYLLTRFTSPDELFGPVSLRQLKERDEFARKLEGYLPTAEVAFIDEIFKASSAILNSLLTLINERLYFNGATVVRVPLLVLFAASNELPDEEELTALYDRFAVRVHVNPILEPDNVLRMLRHPDTIVTWSLPPDMQIPLAEVQRVRAAAAAIPLSSTAERVLLRMKRELDLLAREHPEAPWRFYVSDRRWRQAVKLLRTATCLDGRDIVHVVDTALIRHCLWNRPEDAARVSAALDAALEDVTATFDLDLRGLVVRWVQMLTEMRDHEGVGRPIYDGYVLTHAGTRFVMTDLRAAAAMKNTLDSVRSTGFWFDARNNLVRKVRTRADGAVLFASQYGSTPVADAATFAAQVRGGAVPVFEEGTVHVDRKVNPGMALDFSAISGKLQGEWLRGVTDLREVLVTREGALARTRSDIDQLVEAHLFLGEADVRGLRSGLVRTELVLREWDVKLRTLEEAVAEQREFETADVDAPSAATPESALRLMGDGGRPTRRR